MDVEKTIAFLLEHQASFAVRMDQLTENLNRLAEEGTKTRADLRRAVRLGVQNARAERARCRELGGYVSEMDKRFASRMEELRAAQLKTEQMLQAFIQSMRRPTNGKP